MSRKDRKRFNQIEVIAEEYQVKDDRDRSKLEPKTFNQRHYLNSIKQNIITVGLGSAGTGKTFVALAYAAQELEAKNINKIIITRPIVEAGEELGFLPGDLNEKTQPYMLPMLDVLNRRLGKSTVEYHLKRGNIEFRPLAFMRGTSFNNTFVLLDEAQNTTVSQMKMFLTRIGENCKVVIDGDIDQCDIKVESGLRDLAYRLQFVNNTDIIQFTEDDIVRSGIVKEILMAYRK